MKSKIVSLYWENPDNPKDNGWCYPCYTCGVTGHSEEWAASHTCDPDILKKMKFWENHYSQPEPEEIPLKAFEGF